MTVLMAKSGPGAPTLAEHTRDVMDAAEALFGTPAVATRLGECWLRFFKLPRESWRPFQRTLLAACGLHDWGKANDGFQDTLTRRGEQAIRHEHFSTLLVAHEVCWTWLGAIPDVDREIVLAAVLTHHLKASGKEDWGGKPLSTGSVVRLVGRDDAFRDVVRLVADRLGVDPPDVSRWPASWTVGRPPADMRAQRKWANDNPLRTLQTTVRRAGGIDTRRLLSAVRAGLIAADAAGSGLVRTGRSVDWITANLTRRELVTADTVNGLIDRRVKDVERAKGKAFEWNQFQRDCDTLPERALLLAPCGSGKTLAAWRWIAARLKDRPAGHVLFLYPTRATSREGFADYVSWAPEADAALMHGTSGFDLDGMFANAQETDDRKARRDYEVERRLFSLGYWPRRVFSATVDQFLAFLQYGYGPVCMLPVLADSVVVIDEVHSFDRNMFSNLKGFLCQFDVPVLCMTATLPANRRDDLIACGLTPPPTWPPDLQEIADARRYRLRRAADAAEAEREVRTALAAGKRVLWVVNQVKRAQAIVSRFAAGLPPDPKTTELRTPDGVPVICYHSRFKLVDRVNRHADTMRALKDQPGPALGVSTQVCEMSLDIDADLLITEDCPVTSLVQRMGRCNRDRTPRPLDRAGTVLVYPPAEGDNLPYSPNDLTGLTEFLSGVADNAALSQTDLEAMLQRVPCPESPGDSLSRFLESGPYAVGGADEGDGFREGNDFNRPCLLPEDVPAFLAAGPTGQPGFVLPVPRKWAWERDNADREHAKLPGHLGVTVGGHYHPAVGFCDRPLCDWGDD